ncbi:D-aminoacyl-tRNA deacylase [Haladaptatus sp. DYSN1]|uniref:D-aminoacyl-tRNA deacylase n=1 Tax=unclassified Haladaptatus TaxID=2622732 RepID=UPI0024075C4B|nr:D-aminoacyl-tRNA deacylase [Haladaptatus sp. DYSN1]
MIGIVVSRADHASVHIGEQLHALADWTESTDERRPDGAGGGTVYHTDGFELREFDDLHIELEDAAAAFDDPDYLVFTSRHAGDTGPLLTAHFTGNFGPAEYGGVEGGLARACPNAHKAVVAALAEHAPDGYDVGMECTHHGPSEVGVPSMFVELGSGDEQWEDAEAARAVAEAILSLDGVPTDRERQLVAFGGGHYVPRPTRIVTETDWAVGHIAADWCLADMGTPEQNRETIARAFEQSNAAHAVVDGEKPDLVAVIESLGFRVVSERWVRETDAVALDAVSALETALCSVDDGLRFGTAREAWTDDFTTVSLPADLVQEAEGIDREAVRTAAESTLLAFTTEEAGTRVGAQAAVSDPANRREFVEALVAVLRQKYDEVTIQEDAVVAQISTFDPSKAETLGIPEGPAFGKLASGQPVTIRGREIPPAEVQTRREHRFVL